MRALKMRSAVGGHQKLTATYWEQSSKLILLCKRLPKNSTLTFVRSFGIWSKLERCKSLIRGSFMSWPQKKSLFWSVFSILCNNNESFLHRMVTCDNKWILYDNQQWSTQWFDHEEAPKHFPKPNLHEKKVMVTVWRSVAHLIHYSVQDPGKTITSEKYVQQTDEMHQKLQCLQPALVNKMGPVLHNSARPPITQPALQRLNELGYEVLPHPPYSPDLLPTDYYFFKHYSFL